VTRDAIRVRHQLEGLYKTISELAAKDPEQEVQGIALPVIDAVLAKVRSLAGDDPVVEAFADIVSPDRIAMNEPVRAADLAVAISALIPLLPNATISSPARVRLDSGLRGGPTRRY
jgi:hypothetical protein